MTKERTMTEKSFVMKYIFPSMSVDEKISFLQGSSYPDEDYINELANENNVSIY